MHHDVSIFRERRACLSAAGLGQIEVCLAMADDPTLPPIISQTAIEDQSGLTENALKQRRYRGMPPDFYAVSVREVQYPTASFFRWLASTYQDRSRVEPKRIRAHQPAE